MTPPIWELPLGAAENFWTAELRREQLPDIVRGSEYPVAPLSAADIPNLSPRRGTTTAIWRAFNAQSRSPLPQVIVGDEQTLEDLFAWSASYMRGIGPLTVHTRIITPTRLRHAMRIQPEGLWWRLASGAVGLIIGEVLMHARRPLPLTEISLAACRGTLSFVLMRAAALGATREELAEVTDLWQLLRSHTGQATTVVPSIAIAQVALTVASVALEPNREPPADERNQWFRSFLARGGDSVIGQIANVFGSSVAELVGEPFSALTPEERVRFLDEFAPRLLTQPARTHIEKALAVALIAYLCRPGFAQQATLLAPYSTGLPDCMLWLGALQAAAPFTETLASSDGLGWRLARDLFEADDVFSAPRCDIALPELLVLLRGKSSAKSIKSLNRTRLEVELIPGVSAFVRSLQADVSDQVELPLAPQSNEAVLPQSQDKLNSISDELLSDAKKAMAALSRFIHNARIDPGDEPGARSKRRR
jgi:hypothetical protein